MSLNLSGRIREWRTDLARDTLRASSSSSGSLTPSTPTPSPRHRGATPPRRRTLSALFSLARGVGEGDDSNQVNRPTISRPILNHGPILVPGNGDFLYVHPSRPRLDVEIPRSSFSAFELWEGSSIGRGSEGRRSVDGEGEVDVVGVGSVTDLDDDDEETMLAVPAFQDVRSVEDVASLEATYLLPFVSSTPTPSFSSSSATLSRS